MDRSHPPLDLPVHRLRDVPSGRVWLDHVEGPLGHPAHGVWVGNGARRRDSSRPWAHVCTFRRRTGPPSDLERLTFHAVLAVVDATMPAPEVVAEDRRHDLLDVAVARAADGGWRPATWRVDDGPVAATVFGWAGAWAGFTTGLPDVDVLVVGSGVDPQSLDLVRVHDSATTLGVDLGEPIVFPDTVEASSRAAGLRDEEVPAWWPAHPDHAVTD